MSAGKPLGALLGMALWGIGQVLANDTQATSASEVVNPTHAGESQTTQGQGQHEEAVRRAYQLLSDGATDAGLSLLTEIANSGSITAQVLLGDIYANGYLVTQNFSIAAHWRALAAQRGDASALNALGKHYTQGYGVAADVALAERYLTVAAETGNASFQYDLGVFYDNPSLPVHDATKAVYWYELAVAQDYTPAMASLGLLLLNGGAIEQDLPRAKKLLTIAGKAGHSGAQNNLGILFARGQDGTQDYEKALYWFNEAAEQGHKSAMANLAVMYENGLGVAFNEEEARRLERLAAQQSHTNLATAISSIQYVYDSRLVPLSESVDLTYLTTEAATGDTVAIFQLGWYWLTHPTEPDFVRARQAFENAAASGLREAHYNLGLLYLKGQGVPQDFVAGYRWISQAASMRSADAVYARNLLLPYLTPAQLESAQSE